VAIRLKTLPNLTGIVAASAPRLIKTFTTDLTTQPGDLVRVNGNNTVTVIADNSSGEVPNGIFGVGYSKPTTTSIEVLFCGINGGYSGLTAGAPVFISVMGVPTHTVPTTGMVQQIGFAVSSSEIFFNLMQALRRS
jgi:hypothetical protein